LECTVALSGANKDDPQINMIDQYIPKVPEKEIKIIDFGAGKGRFLEGLPDDVIDKYNYMSQFQN
jgi:hypothetical protein